MTISAKVIADSITPWGQRVTTFELEVHRYVLAEQNTHRLLSRNAQSSRAVPVERMIELIKEDTAIPIHWGKNQPGMQAKEEHDAWLGGDGEFPGYSREDWWLEARDSAIYFAEEFSKKGYHKQIVNRLLEPFMFIKIICTGTDFDNYFWLRLDPDAQPEIKELAHKMWEARESSTPHVLQPGEWHVPYFEDGYWSKEVCEASLEDALAVSSSCTAQVSFRRLDDTIEKARKIYERLISGSKVHASPFEHQCTPIDLDAYRDGFCHDELPKGVTHIDVRTEDTFWSGNFKNWIQYRQLIPGNVCNDYRP